MVDNENFLFANSSKSLVQLCAKHYDRSHGFAAMKVKDGAVNITFVPPTAGQGSHSVFLGRCGWKYYSRTDSIVRREDKTWPYLLNLSI